MIRLKDIPPLAWLPIVIPLVVAVGGFSTALTSHRANWQEQLNRDTEGKTRYREAAARGRLFAVQLADEASTLRRDYVDAVDEQQDAAREQLAHYRDRATFIMIALQLCFAAIMFAIAGVGVAQILSVRKAKRSFSPLDIIASK